MLEDGKKMRVKADLTEDSSHNEYVSVDAEQVAMAGEIVTIDSYSEDFDAYFIKEDGGNFLWHPDMLEEVA